MIKQIQPYEGVWVDPDVEFSGNGTDTVEFYKIKAWARHKELEDRKKEFRVLAFHLATEHLLPLRTRQISKN